MLSNGMPLTNIALKKLKPLERAYKKADSNGLFIWVKPNGSKHWHLKYRFQGKEKLMSYGPYPLISLKEARDKRDRDKKLLLEGIDPGSVKKERKLAAEIAARGRFEVLAEELLDKNRREGKAEQTIRKKSWLLDMANERLGKRPVTEITPGEVLAVLKKQEQAGHLETASRLRSTIGEVFRYAIATGVTGNDPTVALKGALVRKRVKSRSAITDKKQLGKLLVAIDQYTGYRVVSLGLRLLAILHVRPGELRFAKWGEFDLENGKWTIPEERMKTRLEHVAPLPNQAVELLEELKSLSHPDAMVLPSQSLKVKPLSENTFNQALRKMGFSKEEMTAHGFRATFSSLANESGLWNPDAIERALAHIEGNEVRRAYARGAFWDERVEMAQWWADLLDDLQRGATT
ncbi:putative prophage CPS-53 integrase [Roseovarius sp. A-2]|uniref:tyrosine-type recombinase/integrase n=1 Tax=Roseovarius sp. A-2 TaxID=1570360 RepID=UPI0009CE2729|nr:integrase arm-type DNA-binding domain-containing protein [Roseovarius sp. A-2]GAW37147.1 putative prophage CPS-53 integrase [Roseovarius sp. A-2]